MLKKGAIQQTEHQAGEFLSNIFLVGKIDFLEINFFSTKLIKLQLSARS